MGELRRAIPLPGGMGVELVAEAYEWQLHVRIDGPDGRFNSARARLSEKQVLRLLEILKAAVERATTMRHADLAGARYRTEIGQSGGRSVAVIKESGEPLVSMSAATDTYEFSRRLTVPQAVTWSSGLLDLPRLGRSMLEALAVAEGRSATPPPPPKPFVPPPWLSGAWPTLPSIEALSTGGASPFARLYAGKAEGEMVTVNGRLLTVTYAPHPRGRAPVLFSFVAPGAYVAVIPVESRGDRWFTWWSGIPDLADGSATVDRSDDAGLSQPVDSIIEAAIEAFMTRFP